MATTTTRTLLTAEEFLQMDLGEGTHELVRGEIIEVPPAMPEHGRICLNGAYILETYGRQTGFGYVLTNDSAVLTERGPDTLRGADICFYSEVRLPRAQLGSTLAPVVPDLVVEVYSPSNRPGEMRNKVNEYLNAGVLMVWVIYPERRTVAIYRLNEPLPAILAGDDVIENLPELPGFRCPVAEFFV